MNTKNIKKQEKRAADSRVEHVQIVYQMHINGTGRLFGGMLMEWIDTVGAVVARRHAGSQVTTAAVDHLTFKAGVPLNSTVVLIGEITYVGRTSMEVRVDTLVERLDDMRRDLVNRAYIVYVALDADNNPTEVPRLTLENDRQRAEFEAGRKRQELRKAGNQI